MILRRNLKGLGRQWVLGEVGIGDGDLYLEGIQGRSRDLSGEVQVVAGRRQTTELLERWGQVWVAAEAYGDGAARGASKLPSYPGGVRPGFGDAGLLPTFSALRSRSFIGLTSAMARRASMATVRRRLVGCRLCGVPTMGVAFSLTLRTRCKSIKPCSSSVCYIKVF